MIDALDKSKFLIKTINRRPQCDNPHKLPIRGEDLLHISVLYTSDGFEIYQEMDADSPERNFSKCKNNYLPTLDDFIIRYVKQILMHSNDRPARYFAIGTGTLIYNYKIVDILGLSDNFDNNNTSKIKKFYENKISNRFPNLELKQKMTLNERTVGVVQCCFNLVMLPSVRKLDLSHIKNVRNELFSFTKNTDERERLDAIMKYGIGRLITEYNEFVSYGSLLDAPEKKLLIPKINTKNFDNEFDFKHRLNPDQLNESELVYLEEIQKRIHISPPLLETSSERKSKDRDLNIK